MVRPLKIIALAFSFLFALNAFSNLDSLLQVGISERDTFWIDNLVEASWDVMYSDPQRVLIALETATELARSKKLTSKLPRIYINCGIAYDVMDKPDSAMYFYRKGLSLAESLNDTLMMASAHNNMGLIEWNLDHLDSALIYYIESEKLFQVISNARGLNSTMNNIGLIYLDQKRYGDARRYFRKVLNKSIETASKYFESVAYQNLGLTFDSHLHADSAIYFTERAVIIQKELNNQYGLAKSYHSLTEINRSVKNYQTAIDYARLAIILNRKIENYHALASNYYQLAGVYQEQGRKSEALTSIDSAMLYIDQVDDPDLKQKIYEAKVDQELLTHNLPLYNIHLQSTKLKDSLFHHDIEGKLMQLQEAYETEKKNKQIAVQSLEIERQESQLKNQIIISVASLLILAGLIIWLVKRFRYKQKISALEYQNRIQSERDRISKDLHDSVGAQLTSIATRIDLIGTSSADVNTARLEKVSGEARETIQLLRDTIWALKSEDFSYSDFFNRIETYAREHLRGIAELKIKEIGSGGRKLSSAKALNLFRIVQEAIQNIIKHSEASAVEILFGSEKGGSFLSISDNGQGAEPSELEKEEHYGLENLRSRVENIGGKLDIKTGKDEGFSLKLSW